MFLVSFQPSIMAWVASCSSDPKAANKAVCDLSMKSLIVNRENTFSQILGNAIAIELVVAACESHSRGILSLTPLYI